jgi:hypothetical protein
MLEILLSLCFPPLFGIESFARSSLRRMSNLHVLEKLWAVSRVLLFCCRSPKHVFVLTLVNRAFRECMLEYEHGKSVFARIVDARNEWQSEEDVQMVWSQAAAILSAGESCNAELVAEMVAAMRRDNMRALEEFDAAKAAPRARDDPSHSEYLNSAKCVPHPAVAKKRCVQQLGACTAAFRGSPVSWFADLARSRNPDSVSDDEDDSPTPHPSILSTVQKRRENPRADYARICQGEFRDWCVRVVRDSYGLIFELGFMCQIELKLCDTSLLPSTLTWFAATKSPIKTPFDFRGLAAACPRLDLLGLCSCHISMAINLTEALENFSSVTYIDLESNLLRSDAGIDCSRLAPTLTTLSLKKNPLLAGTVRVVAGSRLHIDDEHTQLVTQLVTY